MSLDWARLRAKARAARHLSREEWALFCRAWWLLVSARLRLALLPLPQVQRWAGQIRNSTSVEPAPALADRFYRTIDMAARNHFLRLACLPRALVLQRMLGRRGVPSDLRIGVRRDGDALAAHAWVECDGRPVGPREPGAAEFEPLSATGDE